MLSEQEQENDVFLFWKFIKKNSKTLLYYSLAGALISLIATFFIPKEYNSSGVVFPPSSTSIDNSIDYPNFGYDVEADRLIQIFESSEIRDSATKKFNLINYYKIDTTIVEWKNILMKNYLKNIKFERTAAMSVMVSARTKNPELSAEIVNYLILSADLLREKVYKKNIVLAYTNAKQDFDSQKFLVDSMEFLLQEKLKRNNLNSLLFLMSDVQISFDMDKLNTVNSASDASIGGDIIAFKRMYELLKEYQNRYIKIKTIYTNPIPKLYVLNYGEPNFKKISPSFKTNIAIGLLFAFFVSTAIIFLRHNAKRDQKNN